MHWSKRLPGWSLSALLTLSVALPVALFGWTAWDERQHALRDAEATAVRTVSALHEHAARLFETHELVLAEAARQIEDRAWDDIERDDALWRYLLRIVRDLDHVAGIALADGAGRVRMTTAAFPPPRGASVAGHDVFRRARDGGAASTLVGASRADPGHDADAVVLGRRLSAEDGAFRGVVQVTMPVAHFTGFWERFAPTVAHVIPLVRSDGEVVARYPALRTPERISTAGPFLSRALARREGTYRAVSQVDGVERLNAFTRIKDYPLHISFSVETRAVLAAWRERVTVLGAFSALAAVALAGMTLMAIRQYQAQRAASDRWREAADRLAAEMAAREGAEAALRRAQTLDAVGQLTAGVAHDFNNLLQAIRSGLFLIRKRVPAEADIGGTLDASLQAVDRGAKLVQQLMVFARCDRLEPRPVDLRALLAGMGELLRKAVGTGIRIEAEIAADLHPAMLDPTGAELALLNLAINARDAMADGEGTLTVAARNRSVAEADAAAGIVPGDYVVLSVGDTGAGMTREVRERALEPFFTTKPAGRGTGLGLSMVHGFASQSGGGLSIDSAPGCGTTVHLYLPRALGAAPAAACEAAKPAPGVRARPGATVLLVDDDALGRMATAAALRELGHDVLEARDGREGLAVLGQNPGLALVVTDYAMPGMNGAALAAAVRAARPGLPVMMITGYATEAPDDLERAADAVLRKPFGVEELDARLRSLLRAREGRRAAVA